MGTEHQSSDCHHKYVDLGERSFFFDSSIKVIESHIFSVLLNAYARCLNESNWVKARQIPLIELDAF